MKMKKTIIIIAVITFATCFLKAQNGVYLGAEATMYNSIVWGNADTANVKKSLSGTGTVSYSAVENAIVVGENNITLTETPFVGEGVTGFGKYNVIEGATINAGSNELAEFSDGTDVVDAAGYERSWGTSIDMGAYEYQFPRSVSITAKDILKAVGEADPTLEYELSVDESLGTDVLELELVRASGEDVGTYTINNNGIKILRKNADNIDVTHLYTIAFQTGVFTIKIADGLFEIDNASQISVYPSITNGILHIGGIQNQANISIYDLGGTQLMQKTLNSSDNTIDISAFKSGTFIVRVSENKNIETKKVIKK